METAQSVISTLQKHGNYGESVPYRILETMEKTLSVTVPYKNMETMEKTLSVVNSLYLHLKIQLHSFLIAEALKLVYMKPIYHAEPK
jgi:hypothetical protein